MPPHRHTEWLNLVDSSGPFLALPVLARVFPQGLDGLDLEVKRRLRTAWDEWQDAQTPPRRDPALHSAWIRFVLLEVLGFSPECLLEPQQMPTSLRVPLLEHHEVLQPDRVVVNPTWDPEPGKPRLLLQNLPPGTRLDAPLKGRPWSASPETRMLELLKATGVPLGLITNGERWVLMHRLPDAPTGQVAFEAPLWLEEPLTLRAFTSLLGAHRFFSVPLEDTLEAMLRESLTDQHEVTDQLGQQVRRAVEVLIQAIDRIDADRNRSLLKGVRERQLYLAATKVMMRLIFLLAAEERGLLLLGRNTLYDACYAVSPLRDQLREIADKHGEEVLERRFDAWSRLLATFRAVHGGVHHTDLQLPAYQGSLFDPDEFPFLEGRPAQTAWRETPAQPLPLHNRTVLHLLEALQLLEVRMPGRGREAGGGHIEARRLSFKGLGPEQIGHVYEGLLDHTALRAEGLVLGLAGTKKLEPEVPLTTLEALLDKGESGLLDWLKEHTGRSPAALKRALGEGMSPRPGGIEVARWLAACENDPGVWQRVRPFAGLVRLEQTGWPVLFPKGSLYVTEGTDRRASGTHYTPRDITEPVVQHTLEPLVYEGPAEGKPRETWQLRSPRELLSLKVCDPAMGSGAFLVQACRYLAARLCEAWEKEGRGDSSVLGTPNISVPGRADVPSAFSSSLGGRDVRPTKLHVLPEGLETRGAASEQLVPDDPDERLLVAKRIVAERCLYGVDKNPTAVEIAKLSLWLETLSAKPFTFVDHALRSGDSLLGVTRAEQVIRFHLQSTGEQNWVFQGDALAASLAVAQDKREALEGFLVLESGQFEQKERLRKEAEAAVAEAALIADTLLGISLSYAGRPDSVLESALKSGATRLAIELGGDTSTPALRESRWHSLRHEADRLLGLEPDGTPRRPFHWPLEFPEVFRGAGAGFDAILGNPPFMGGQKITGNLGTDYRDHLVHHLAGDQRGSADLCAYFFLRTFELLKTGGMFGLIATNTIAQGDTREVGLDQVVKEGGTLTRAVSSQKWPGQANLEIAQVWGRRGAWTGARLLEGQEVPAISAFLTRPGKVEGKPFRLKANAGKSFIGSYVLGMGFVMTPEEAQGLIDHHPRNADVLFPYLNGEDLNSRWDQSPSRWVINFRDWPLDRKAGGSWATASEEQQKLWRRAGSVPADYPAAVAEDYPDCIAIVREKVKPERDKNNRPQRRDRWWQFAERCPDLYATIEGMGRVMVHAFTAKYTSLGVYDPKAIVFSHMTVIFPLSEWRYYALLESDLHREWALLYGNKLENRPQYSPSDCFETFPFPGRADVPSAFPHSSSLESKADGTSALPGTGDALLEEIGSRYHAHRQSIMTARQEGLTKTYNRFHDPKEVSADIVQLRALHRSLDEAVARAYGWEDLTERLGHGFHETKQGVRYTLSEAARQEVLERLLLLNHQRHAEEEATLQATAEALKQKLPPKPAKSGKKPPKREEEAGDGRQGRLF